ncbi:hypothetical protein ACOMHN_054296 [Nucella lapillus]
MLMMKARVQGHRWVDHPAAAVMEARVPGQWVDRPAAVVMEAREQGRCWIDHPAAAVMEARVQGRHWVDRPSMTMMEHIGRWFLLACCIVAVTSAAPDTVLRFLSHKEVVRMEQEAGQTHNDITVESSGYPEAQLIEKTKLSPISQ